MEKTLRTLLHTLKDPFLNLTAEEMQIQCTLEPNEQGAMITLLAGFPIYYLEHSYKPLLVAALQAQCPQQAFHLEIKQVIRPHRTQLLGKGLRHVKNTIAVASGKGGVGKSTVTVNLAAALAKAGARVGILDADIYGPSIPLMLGPHEPVQVAEDRYLPVRAHGLQAMSIAYLTTNDEQALIWRGPMLAKSFLQMLDITAWDDLDYLFIDLPPGTGDIQLSLVQKIPLTTAIVVTTPQQVATLDAQKAMAMFAKTGIDVLGLVENMAIHHCKQCGHEEAIFGQDGAKNLCERYQCTLLGQLPLNAQVRENADQGLPSALSSEDALSSPFIKTAMKAAIELAKKPINYADKLPPVVVEK